MKFGQALREATLPKWGNRYFAYSSLKGVIKSIVQQRQTPADAPTPKQVSSFVERIRSELKKIDSFYKMKLGQLRTMREVLENRVSEARRLPASTLLSAELSLRRALHLLETELNNVLEFCAVNKTAVCKIVKKFDKKCPGAALLSQLDEMLQRAKFTQLDEVESMITWCRASRGDLHQADSSQAAIVDKLASSMSRVASLDGSSKLNDLQPLLFHAIQTKDLNSVQQLLTYIDDREFFDLEGNTPLALACELGQTAIVEALLNAHFPPNAISKMDRTPLHIACIFGSFSCTKALLNAGASCNQKDVELNSAMHYCAIKNNMDCLRLLLDRGAKVNIRDINGNTVLAIAALNGSTLCIELLLARGAIVDSFNWFAQMPLHLACRNGHNVSVKMLLAAKSSIDCLDVTGRSSVHECTKNGHVEVLQTLLESKSADSTVHCAADIEGFTPLHSASFWGRLKCAEILLNLVDNPMPLDRFGWSPRDYALYCGHLIIADLFPEYNTWNPKPLNRKPPVQVEDTFESEHIVIKSDHVSAKKRFSTILRRPCEQPDLPKRTTLHNDKIVLSTPPVAEDDLPVKREGICKVSVRIRARVRANRYVCISGDSDFLGEWNPLKAKPMTRETIDQSMEDVTADVGGNEDEPLSTWSLILYLKMGESIQYKYLIMSQSVLEIWEVLPMNRTFGPAVHAVSLVDDGVFGTAAGHEAESWTSQGWLVDDLQLHIRLGHVTQRVMKPPVSLFCVDTPDMIQVGYISQGNTMFRTIQLPMFDKMETIKFQIRKRDGELPDFSILFDIFCGRGFKIGTGAAVASALLADSEGHTTVPIFTSMMRAPIGEVSFEWLVIRPFNHLNMKTVLSRCFSKSTKLIGHRGAGATKHYGTQPERRFKAQENTILSFLTAASLGAEYIEFDVQFTKDHVPIIYHDWCFHLPGLHGIPNIPVSAITSKEFLALRSLVTNRPDRTQDDVDLHQRRKRLSLDAHSIAHEIRDQYPTLKETFRQVPEHVGFNIELKYPPEITKNQLGVQFAARNQFVDGILKCVFDYAGARRIIFSSFDPDICTMASLKQPSYPVLFLTEAGDSPCWDPRGQSIREAIRFAKRQNLLGIVSFADPLLKSPKIITTVKAAGLVLCTWSSKNNEVANIKLSHEFGVDAIVCDRIAYVTEELRKTAAS